VANSKTYLDLVHLFEKIFWLGGLAHEHEAKLHVRWWLPELFRLAVCAWLQRLVMRVGKAALEQITLLNFFLVDRLLLHNLRLGLL